MAIDLTRTDVGSIQNHRQVCGGLDSLGDSASRIWNVARWTADCVWGKIGEIPDEGVLKSYMKDQSCWKEPPDGLPRDPNYLITALLDELLATTDAVIVGFERNQDTEDYE